MMLNLFGKKMIPLKEAAMILINLDKGEKLFKTCGGQGLNYSWRDENFRPILYINLILEELVYKNKISLYGQKPYHSGLIRIIYGGYKINDTLDCFHMPQTNTLVYKNISIDFKEFKKAFTDKDFILNQVNHPINPKEIKSCSNVLSIIKAKLKSLLSRISKIPIKLKQSALSLRKSLKGSLSSLCRLVMNRKSG